MQFIHHFGLTHTDLKLENVLFASNEEFHSIANDANELIQVPNTRHIQGMVWSPMSS